MQDPTYDEVIEFARRDAGGRAIGGPDLGESGREGV